MNEQVLNKYEINRSLETIVAKEKYLGKEFISNSSGKFRVIGVYDRDKHGMIRFVVEFENSKNQIIIRASSILTKGAKDPFAKTIKGVGYIGNYKGNVKYNKYYQTWKMLLERSFPTEHRKKHTIYENCTICDDWLCFDIFQNDCNHITGIAEKEKYQNVKFQLDKDILVHGNKHYSKENCIWIPQKLNSFFTNINTRNISGYEGVSLTKDKSYATCISINGKTKYIASSHTPEEAYLKYCKIKNEVLNMYLEGEFCYLNEDIKTAMRMKLLQQQYEKGIKH